nr:15964_t:CDS:2 [Entrophospora candida]
MPNTTNLKAENNKLNTRVVKLEQSSNNITHELENSVLHEASSSKLLEDIETDNFLDVQSKKEVSDMMRKRSKEKKLQTQGSHNTSLPMSTLLIPSEISISNDDSPEVFEALDLKTKNQNQSKSQNESHKKKGTENIAQAIADGIQDALAHSSTDNIHSDLNHVTEISVMGHCQNSDTISLLDLAQLFDKATNAEYYAMKANQEETLCWINYGNEFIIQYNDLMKNSNSKIGEKKAKGLQLPEISRKTLCRKTQRALTNDQIQKIINNNNISDRDEFNIEEESNHMTEISTTSCHQNHETEILPENLPEAKVSIPLVSHPKKALLETEVNALSASQPQTETKTLPKKQNNPTHNHAYFHNKILL